jgi:hypothetical protein
VDGLVLTKRCPLRFNPRFLVEPSLGKPKTSSSYASSKNPNPSSIRPTVVLIPACYPLLTLVTRHRPPWHKLSWPCPGPWNSTRALFCLNPRRSAMSTLIHRSWRSRLIRLLISRLRLSEPGAAPLPRVRAIPWPSILPPCHRYAWSLVARRRSVW